MEPSNSNYIYVGFWRRFAACIIDAAISSLLFCIFAVITQFIVGFTAAVSTHTAPVAQTVIGLLLCLVAIVGVFFPIVIYFAYTPTTYWQATPGKRLLGMYIINTDGSKPSFWKLLGRHTIGYTLSSLPINIGYLMIAFTKDKEALHDMVFKTKVVEGKIEKKKI